MEYKYVDLIIILTCSKIRYSFFITVAEKKSTISNLFFSSAPSGYPQNVVPTTISSTEILVSWSEVPLVDQNGVIILYEVQYEPLVTLGGELMTMTMNTSNTSIVLGGLEEYVEYNISVRAYTSVGPGPFSLGVDNRTFEDGMNLFVFLHLDTIFARVKIFLWTSVAS